MPKEKDPNEGLADDAALATDLGDEAARKTEQLSYFGGDPDDDGIDLDDDADRGDNLEPEGDNEDRGDEVDEKSEEESQDEEEASEEDDGEELPADASEDGEDDDSEDGDSGDSEDEADQADDDESEDSDEEVGEPKEKGIPRHRFNEVNTRMREAEAKVARLEAEKTAGDDAAVDKFDFDAAEDEYMALLLDGKTKDAGAKRREIREAEKADFQADAVAESTSSVSQAQMEERVDALSKEAERMFPEFDENSETFNPQAVSKTLTFMRGYQTDGMTADDAFVAALADVIDIFDLATEQQGDEDTGEEKPGKKVTKKKDIKKVKEKLAAAKKQGKSPAGEGKGSSDVGAAVVDVEQLSEDEIEALPAETLARLRGDFV